MLRVSLTLLGLVLLATPGTTARADITTFENLGLPPNTYLNDAGSAGQFVIDGNHYNNSYNPMYDSWSGWSISSTTDRTTPGYTNQYSSITGGGANGSATYAVGFTYGDAAFSHLGLNPGDPAYVSSNPFHPSDTYLTLAAGKSPLSIALTNTTYSYLAFRDGDPYGFAPAFKQGDYQLLDIRGYNAAGTLINTVDFYLADYRSSDPTQWSIVNTWQTVDLSSLAGATTLQFGIQSSQNDPTYGVNTPAYFAADNFQFGPLASGSPSSVPEPTSLILLAIGGLGVAALRVRQRAATLLGAGLIVAIAPATGRASFDPQVGQPGSLGISRSSSAFVGWASSVLSFTRGPQDISNPNSPLASVGDPANALGSSGGLVSLGDGGSITLGFDRPIANGLGADFAVFENGFLSGGAGLAFLELATVDVSSDGIHFFRFPSVSLTQTTTQVGGFGLLDASNLHDLAGKYIAGFGTGFDLDELAGVSPFLDVNDVIAVRITDVVGSIDPRYGTRDSLGNLINDPFSTPFASSGFDLTGVGVIHASAVPEPASALLCLVAGGSAVGLRRCYAGRDRRATRRQAS